MPCPRVALRLLERLDAHGTHEALLGDLVEEINLGRSRCWVWQQIAALYAGAAVSRVRTAAEGAHVMVLAPSLVLMVGLWLAPLPNVLAAWAVAYYVSGALSLVGHLIASHMDDWGALRSERLELFPDLDV